MRIAWAERLKIPISAALPIDGVSTATRSSIAREIGRTVRPEWIGDELRTPHRHRVVVPSPLDTPAAHQNNDDNASTNKHERRNSDIDGLMTNFLAATHTESQSIDTSTPVAVG